MSLRLPAAVLLSDSVPFAASVSVAFPDGRVAGFSPPPDFGGLGSGGTGLPAPATLAAIDHLTALFVPERKHPNKRPAAGRTACGNRANLMLGTGRIETHSDPPSTVSVP